ncbi:MAG: TonB family protein [Myxococcales bacterium]|nr:TonB family protein [Myxococcales bacterium]
MFEAVLPTHDRQRTQRLLLAGLIALAGTSATLATTWTLERLIVDRVGPPEARFDLAQLSFLPPPPVAKPPPPPEIEGGAAGGESDRRDPAPSRPVADEGPSEPEPKSIGKIPEPDRGFSGLPPAGFCPGGICPAKATGTGTGTCVGIHCKKGPGGGGTGIGTGSGGGAPRTVPFSAMSCLACVDPDPAELRKTAAGIRQQGGKVVVHFCVDRNGKVEAGSLRIKQSFGDAAVDAIAKKAVGTWRFSPMEIDGEARRACSDARFSIQFR